MDDYTRMGAKKKTTKKTPVRRRIKTISVTKEKTGKPWMIIKEWVPKKIDARKVTN